MREIGLWFTKTVCVTQLSSCTDFLCIFHSSLPKIILVHGTDDHVVPVSSTSKLADILTEKFADITVRILPGCDHYEVCLDLMQPKRKCYESVMGIIMETASKVLKWC